MASTTISALRTKAVDVAEQRGADQAADQGTGGPGHTQPELGPQHPSGGELRVVAGGKHRVRLVAQCEHAVGLAGPAVHPVQRERQAVEQVVELIKNVVSAMAAMGAPAVSMPFRMNSTEPANIAAEMTGASH